MGKILFMVRCTEIDQYLVIRNDKFNMHISGTKKLKIFKI